MVNPITGSSMVPSDTYPTTGQPLLPNQPVPPKSSTPDKKKAKQHKGKTVSLSKVQKAKRYDQLVTNDKTTSNKDAQIGDFLDRMTFESDNLFPTNAAGMPSFVPSGFGHATVRGTKFSEPPIPFAAPEVQASVNAAEFFVKYNQDNPVGGPYTDKSLYNDQLHVDATKPAPLSYAERVVKGWDFLTPQEQQTFQSVGGQWFIDNFVNPSTSTQQTRDANIQELVRIINEQNSAPNTSNLSPLYGSPAPYTDNLVQGQGVDSSTYDQNAVQWLQNNTSALNQLA